MALTPLRAAAGAHRPLGIELGYNNKSGVSFSLPTVTKITQGGLASACTDFHCGCKLVKVQGKNTSALKNDVTSGLLRKAVAAERSRNNPLVLEFLSRTATRAEASVHQPQTSTGKFSKGAVLALSANATRQTAGRSAELLPKRKAGSRRASEPVPPAVKPPLLPPPPVSSRRRDCHSAAPPSTCSRCNNSDGERVSEK